MIDWERNIYGDCRLGVEADWENCVRYAYATFYAFFEVYTGNPPTIWDWLSATFTGELATWRNSYEEPLEALARNFLDLQTGACRYDVTDEGYLCTYEQYISWSTGIEFWYRYIVNEEQQKVRVRLEKILGLEVAFIKEVLLRIPKPVDAVTMHKAIEVRGLYDYDGFIREGTENITNGLPSNLTTWRSGQGPDVPSTWGNTVLETGTTHWTPTSEHYVPLIVHIFPNNTGASISSPPNTTTTRDGQNVVCTYLAVVTTTEGRLQNLSSCSVDKGE